MKKFQFNGNNIHTSDVFKDNERLKLIAEMIVGDFFQLMDQTGMFEYATEDSKGAMLMCYMSGALRNTDIISIEEKNLIIETLYIEVEQ